MILLLLIHGILNILFGLLLLFLQVPDLLSQFFDPAAVGGEQLQVAGNVSGKTCGIGDLQCQSVQFFGVLQLFFCGIQFFQSLIKLLGLNAGKGLGNGVPPGVVDARSGVEQCLAAQIGPSGGFPDDLFVQFSVIFLAVDLPFAGKVVKLIRLFRKRLFGGRLRRKRFGRSAEQDRTQHQYRRFARPLGNQQIKQINDRRRKQCKRKLFHRKRAFSAVLSGLIKLFDLAVDHLGSGSVDGAVQIHTAGFTGQLTEIFFRQTRGDDFAVCTPAERTLLIGNGCAVDRIAQADDEKRDIPLFEHVDQFPAVALQFIAVGKEQDRPVLSGGGFEGLCRFGKGLFEVGSAQRNEIGGKFIHVLSERRRIGRQRTGGIGGSGKSDQAETILRVAADDFTEHVFCVFQPRGGDVGRQHAFGNVKQYGNIPAVLTVRNDTAVPVGPRRRRKKEKDCKHCQKQPQHSFFP